MSSIFDDPTYKRLISERNTKRLAALPPTTARKTKPQAAPQKSERQARADQDARQRGAWRADAATQPAPTTPAAHPSERRDMADRYPATAHIPDMPEVTRQFFERQGRLDARAVDVPRIVAETSLPSLAPARGPGVSSGPVRFDGSADPKLVELARKASQQTEEVKRRARERDKNAWKTHRGSE